MCSLYPSLETLFNQLFQTGLGGCPTQRWSLDHQVSGYRVSHMVKLDVLVASREDQFKRALAWINLGRRQKLNRAAAKVNSPVNVRGTAAGCHRE
jgi:hypothetical protein